MNDVPLRSLFVSDFRRLEGHRTLPLDAPVVLIHGPNGTGKTSLLSALELALTGEIRSMRRQDDRYTAHLPFHGQEFATLRAEVADELSAQRNSTPMTVGGSRVEGTPALNAVAAQFYTERCYLDQVSLGRLLEIYQFRDRNEESALTRFVNELLGLEQLDALHDGLSASADVRNLRRLSPEFANAEATAKRVTTALSEASQALDAARAVVANSRISLVDAIVPLGIAIPGAGEGEAAAVREIATALSSSVSLDDGKAASSSRSLVSLGGRIQALSSRPSTQRLEEARAALVRAKESYELWTEEHGPAIAEWRTGAAALGLDASETASNATEIELARIDESFNRQSRVVEEMGQLDAQLAANRELQQLVEARLLDVQESVGSIVEGLTLLREESVDNVCPVCDRDFTEVSTVHLASHIDQKISELTSRGAELRESRLQREAVVREISRDVTLRAEAALQAWSATELEAENARRLALRELDARFRDLLPSLEAGVELEREWNLATTAFGDLESIAREAEVARAELEALAAELGAATPDADEALEAAWQRINSISVAELAREDARQRAVAVLDSTVAAMDRVAELTGIVAEAAAEKLLWDDRVREARRRQSIAKTLFEASSRARASIVQRVFTESLNEVWRGVFKRLAPREQFVPRFGMPNATRGSMDLTLETVHSSGQSGGSPQMMLSAGNLNTAALSLFVALHLAVEPVVRCLVLDDPVQSMDEVHVAQLAGLIRMLAKRHDRQVIIAVHERELFQYLCLELSPAFEGDELISIELGARQEDEDGGVIRHSWAPDDAIAM
jgi:exonuclease SbcC